MSYIIPASSSKVEIMRLSKTGSSDLTNMPYNIPSGQKACVDLGSSNWTEDTVASDHPSIQIEDDFGIKFSKPGIYQVNAGFFLYGQSAQSGTTATIAQCLASTTPSDPTNNYYLPSPGPAADLAYSRFDYALANGQVLAVDPDYSLTVKVDNTMTVYFYVECTVPSGYIVRGNASPISGIAIIRLGDAV